MSAYSEKCAKRFHPYVLEFEEKYQGDYSTCMIGDDIWGLVRETEPHYKKIRKIVCFR